MIVVGGTVPLASYVGRPALWVNAISYFVICNLVNGGCLAHFPEITSFPEITGEHGSTSCPPVYQAVNLPYEVPRQFWKVEAILQQCFCWMLWVIVHVEGCADSVCDGGIAFLDEEVKTHKLLATFSVQSCSVIHLRTDVLILGTMGTVFEIDIVQVD